MPSFSWRLQNKVRELLFRRVWRRGAYVRAVSGRAGLEIGGPSAIFRRDGALSLYGDVGRLDNCNFSAETVWSTHDSDFVFDASKPAGRTYVCEGSNLTPVATGSYDFVLSSHNLEHFANPVKALLEWKRVLRPGGSLVLVLPHSRHTFDHHRQVTSVDHMFQDFEQSTAEDDMTHLPEILEKHDLSRDPGAGTAEAFRVRSVDNIANRCLHHHVFDEENSAALLQRAGYAVESVDNAFPFHLCILARATAADVPVPFV